MRLQKKSLLFTTAIFLFSIIFTSLYAAPVRVINLPKPNLPFSDGILAGNTLYIAGQNGMGANQKMVSGGIVPQTQMALSKIEKVVHEAGFRMKDVVSTTVYLSNMHDYQKMNAVYRRYFPNPTPTRVTVQVSRLALHAHIEISAIAVR